MARRWRWPASVPTRLSKSKPYLARHPHDLQRQFAPLRMLFEARADGKPSTKLTNQDKELFGRWSAAYAAAKGPQLAMVQQWQKAFGR